MGAFSSSRRKSRSLAMVRRLASNSLWKSAILGKRPDRVPALSISTMRRNRRYCCLDPAFMPFPCGRRMCGLLWNGSPDFGPVQSGTQGGRKADHRFLIS